jgi:hypothetical protein
MSESCSPAHTSFRCAWSWLSGLFAAPAFVHLVRLLAGWDVTIGTYSVPMWISWAGLVLFGTLSIICAILGCGKKSG